MTYFILYDSPWVHPHLYKWPNFVPFYVWVIFHVYRYHIFLLIIYWVYIRFHTWSRHLTYIVYFNPPQTLKARSCQPHFAYEETEILKSLSNLQVSLHQSKKSYPSLMDESIPCRYCDQEIQGSQMSTKRRFHTKFSKASWWHIQR